MEQWEEGPCCRAMVFDCCDERLYVSPIGRHAFELCLVPSSQRVAVTAESCDIPPASSHSFLQRSVAGEGTKLNKFDAVVEKMRRNCGAVVIVANVTGALLRRRQLWPQIGTVRHQSLWSVASGQPTQT